MILLALSRSAIVGEDDNFVGAGIAMSRSKPWLVRAATLRTILKRMIKVEKIIISSSIQND
jgi:hypothetical protein